MLTARLALSRPRWISVPTMAPVRPAQLAKLSVSRRISLAARPAFFWKAVMGSVERVGGCEGGATELWRGAAVVVGGADRAGAVIGTGLERLTNSIGGWVEDGAAFVLPE